MEERWILPRWHKISKADSRDVLKWVGFSDIRPESLATYSVIPPTGWEKKRIGKFFEIRDEKGRLRFTGFVRGEREQSWISADRRKGGKRGRP